MGGYRKTILKALPGMTGLWQASGKNKLTVGDRSRLEEYYIRNWSLWLDFVILVKTVKVISSQRIPSVISSILFTNFSALLSHFPTSSLLNST